MTSLPSINKMDEKQKEDLKDRFAKAARLQVFLMVVAHTLNLQCEAILIRNAFKGDLGKAARASSLGNAFAGVFGLLLNQIGGKLTDSFGRRFAFLLGPLCQMTSGLACYTMPTYVPVLVSMKALKMMATTFSGTIAVGAGMRDMFQGQEFAMQASKMTSVSGSAIMVGPLLEGLLLKYSGPGNERVCYLGLAALGALASINPIPETLSIEKAAPINFANALKAANPFGFVTLFTQGTPAVKKLVSITTLQTLIDGKNLSDLVQIWTREHLKMQMETIRNFIMGYGLASVLSGAKLIPFLLKNLSTRSFTTFTNITNFLGFVLRGSAENVWVFFGALPLMLPGVNAASMSALSPVLNDHMKACGWPIGESTAWMNNLRVLSGAAVTMLYGYFYSWCQKKRISPGLTFSVGAFLGAALPQLMLMSLVKESELEKQKEEA